MRIKSIKFRIYDYAGVHPCLVFGNVSKASRAFETEVWTENFIALLEHYCCFSSGEDYCICYTETEAKKEVTSKYVGQYPWNDSTLVEQ